MYAAKKAVISKEKEAERKKQHTKDHQMVKGRFTFKEVPGGVLCFSYFKHKGDEVLRYELKDGDIYTLPYMVAKHLAKDVFTEVFQNQVDKDGKPIQVATSKIHRTGFERLDFDEDIFVKPDAITIEYEEVI